MTTNKLERAMLSIPGTERAPEVTFDFAAGHLRLSGESYPEDVTSFYGPVLDSLGRFLDEIEDQACRFDLSLIYFNSASAKVIMTLLEMLDAAAEAGNQVDVHWYYDPEDDTMQELGEEFGEDLEHANFHLEEMSE